MSFEGLSSPNDLKEMWKEIKKDKMSDDLLNVIWEYTSPKQLKPGFNVVNIKYNPKKPNEIGHYCLIIVDERAKYVEFFNPVADRTSDDLEKLIQLNNYFTTKHYNVEVDLSGEQEEGTEDCGYHCLTHAFNNIYRFKDKESGEIKPEATTSEKLDDIIKLLRGIYYGLKFGFDSPTKKGKGVADHVSENVAKNINYDNLKEIVKEYVKSKQSLSNPFS